MNAARSRRAAVCAVAPLQTAGHILDGWRRHLIWTHERLCYRRRTTILNSIDQDFLDEAISDYCHALDMVWQAQQGMLT